ncbi:Tuliposide A-converting enzyme b2, amyloplastic [Zea mays]|uniref:Tuliposide A-converting enzyme b2, amyloplastic n=1 Tax=Zea mays TaxID=4577 RepID=A0A3L6DRQ3_MAIZE|nr:Tuliposide A-converting enzyme b2, amyloplastic [Zea mays]
MFQHDAETHAKVREGVLIRNDLPSRTAGLVYDKGCQTHQDPTISYHTSGIAHLPRSMQPMSVRMQQPGRTMPSSEETPERHNTDQGLLQGVLNPHAAIEPDSKLEFDMPDALRVYKIDCVERFDDTKSVPSSPNGNSTNGVASKDFATGISSRLYLPARVDPEKKLPIVVFFHDGAFMVHNASFPLYHIYIASVDVAVPASR